eukprot:gene17851-36506_t
MDCPVMPAGEPLSVWHFDFYRFNDPREWEGAGFRELFASPGLKLVEWPERAGAFLPAVDLQIDIQPDDMNPHTDPEHDSARTVRATALTPTGLRLRRTLLRSSTLVLLLGVQHIARGASVLAVRIWPAEDYTRVTIESDGELKAQKFFVTEPP